VAIQEGQRGEKLHYFVEDSTKVIFSRVGKGSEGWRRRGIDVRTRQGETTRTSRIEIAREAIGLMLKMEERAIFLLLLLRYYFACRESRRTKSRVGARRERKVEREEVRLCCYYLLCGVVCAADGDNEVMKWRGGDPKGQAAMRGVYPTGEPNKPGVSIMFMKSASSPGSTANPRSSTRLQDNATRLLLRTRASISCPMGIGISFLQTIRIRVIGSERY
jgi:hypothetical protein